MDINKLKKEVKDTGINAVARKYKLKKNKIKEMLGNKSNITTSSKKNNMKDVVKECATDTTKDTINCNIDTIDMEKLKLLIDKTDDILRLVERKEIKLKNNESIVTSLRINKELYDLVKDYSKKNNVTITEILNQSIINFLQVK